MAKKQGWKTIETAPRDKRVMVWSGQVKEWIEDDSGPRCTAFVEAGNVVPEVDTLTGGLIA